MRLMLNSIVKNESTRIERMLKSVAPYISSFVIIDTGSTDDTKQKIIDFFKNSLIIGEIRDEPFMNWSQARNAALQWSRKLNFAYAADYFMLVDADMELQVENRAAFLADRVGRSYDMWQKAGACEYQNRRLVSAAADGEYRGVTHEYLDIPADGLIERDVAWFYDHADGANRPDKFKRDIKLLKGGLVVEPDNVRYMFYLANSFRDAGKHADAAKWFQRRIDAGGWDEEVWQSHVNLAHCHKALGQDHKFIAELLAAYHRRPGRAEPMYDLAQYYREKSMNAPALAAAEAVQHLPKSRDALFVNDFVYTAGIKEEIAINSFYIPGKMAQGLRAADELSMQKSDYWTAINSGRANMFWYLQPLAEYCPSFEWKNIGFTPADGWAATNPSVTRHAGVLRCNVRCVNYRMDEEGRYLIRNTETGDVNNENPINTQNFYLKLGVDPFHPTPKVFALDFPGERPVVEYPLVIGCEDIRLFSHGDGLYGSSTMRQLSADGQCEQVLTQLCADHDHAGYHHGNMQRMLRTPRDCEKNWAPIVDSTQPIRFMWRPGHVIGTDGEFITRVDPDFRTDNMSGSSQVISFRGEWLSILHTAHPLPGASYKRHYYHRFVLYDEAFRVKRISLPFYFNDKGIEFCAGMCFHPQADQLVISYGWRDCEARIATLEASEVEKMLWNDQTSR